MAKPPPALESAVRAALAPLQPLLLEIDDRSAAHAGHTGAAGGAHLGLRLCSAAFAGRSRIERHRLVYAAMGELLSGRVHALTMRLEAPAETRAAQ